MNLVDSYGWLEYFADGRKADFYAPAIEKAGTLIVPTICLFEVFKRILQQRGEDAALQAAALMHQGEVVDLDARVAMQAARTGIEFTLPAADSIILATAMIHGAVVWTHDSHLQGMKSVRFAPE